MNRKTFKSYLLKIQKLQTLAFEHGLDFSFGTRDANTKTEAWCVGMVYPENISSFAKEDDGVTFINFYFYDWHTIPMWDDELARIEKWILEHDNTIK